MTVKLENECPTETEKILFRYYGLYVVQKDEWTIKYSPIHIDGDYKEFQ